MEHEEFFKPMTIGEQIENLKKLHLEIEDEDDVRKKLNRVSYYRLIKAYSYHFKNKNTGVYSKNISFNDVYSLYELDKKMREILFPLFERIETTLRCRIINYHCIKYGPLGYLEEQYFEDGYYKLRDKIDKTIEDAKHNPIIEHFNDDYDGKIPLYAAVEVFSFGLLIDFYRTMKVADRVSIANMYYKGHERYLITWFESISNLRNICAHFGRLYGRNLTKLPLLFNPLDNLPKNNRLFRILCCMRYLCREYGDWSSFVGSIDDLVKEGNGRVKLSAFGLSDGWFEKLLDQEPPEKIKKALYHRLARG